MIEEHPLTSEKQHLYLPVPRAATFVPVPSMRFENEIIFFGIWLTMEVDSNGRNNGISTKLPTFT